MWIGTVPYQYMPARENVHNVGYSTNGRMCRERFVPFRIGRGSSALFFLTRIKGFGIIKAIQRFARRRIEKGFPSHGIMWDKMYFVLIVIAGAFTARGNPFPFLFLYKLLKYGSPRRFLPTSDHPAKIRDEPRFLSVPDCMTQRIRL